MQVRSVILTAAFLVVPMLVAQSKPSVAGHWEGLVQMPDRQIKVALDLARNDTGEWIGDLDMPDLRILDSPLKNIVVNGAMLFFTLTDAPSAPPFQGLLSEDGKEIKGQFSDPNGALFATMKRLSEPNVKLPVKSTPISKELEGAWEGTLSQPDGRKVQFRVTLANGPESATGTLDSLDRAPKELPLVSIVQQGPHIRFALKSASGHYRGQLQDGSLVGEWSLDGSTTPLTLRRITEETAK
jgi:hypothetical protein